MICDIVFLDQKKNNLDTKIAQIRYLEAKISWFYIRLAAILNYGGHLVLINYSLVYDINSLKLNIYYQAFKSSFYPQIVNLCTFC